MKTLITLLIIFSVSMIHAQTKDYQIVSDIPINILYVMTNDTSPTSITYGLGYWREAAGFIGQIDTAYVNANDSLIIVDVNGDTLVAFQLGGGSGTDTWTSIKIDGAVVSTNAPVLNFLSSDFTLTESPTDEFEIIINNEKIQDVTGGMFTGNTEIGAVITYDDALGKIDIVINDESEVNELTNLEVDGVDQSTGAVILDLDGTDFTVVESPVDNFDITINPARITGLAGTTFYEAGTTVVPNAITDDIYKPSGRVGIGLGTYFTTPVSQLQVGLKLTDDNPFVYDPSSLVVVNQTVTTGVLNDPKSTLFLGRQGNLGVTYGLGATFNLSRFENFGVYARTRIDLALAHNEFDAMTNPVMTWLSNSKVGIGKTDPKVNLHVKGTSADIGSGDNTLGRLILEGTAANALHFGNSISSPYGSWIQSATNNTPGTTYPLYLNPLGGNVGIGNLSPQQPLHVTGTAMARATSAIVDQSPIRVSGGAVGFSGDNENGITHSIVFDLCAFNNVAISQQEAGMIGVKKELSWNEAATGGAGTKSSLIFKTQGGSVASPSLTEKFRIESSGKLNASQYDATPITGTAVGLLGHEADGDIVSVALTGGDHGGLTGLTDDDHPQYALLAGRTSGQTLIGGTGTTDDLILRSTSGVGASGSDMVFQVGNNGGTEAMRILFDGKIGMGVTPVAPLHLAGTGATTTLALFENTNTAGRMGMIVRQSTAGGGAQFDLRSYGSAYVETLFGTSMTDAGALIAQNNALFVIGNYSNVDMLFGTNNIERARFKNSGEFGIGTGSTVSAKFHVIGTAEQQRLGYDASNYFSTTVGSTGSATFDLTGTSPRFIYNDPLDVVSSTFPEATFTNSIGAAGFTMKGTETLIATVGQFRFNNTDPDIGTDYTVASILVDKSSATAAGGSIKFNVGYNSSGSVDQVLRLESRETGATQGVVNLEGGVRYQWTDQSATTHTLTTGEYGLRMTNAGTKTVTLPDLNSTVRGQFYTIYNDNATGDLTINAFAGDTIVGDNVLNPGEYLDIEGASTSVWLIKFHK